MPLVVNRDCWAIRCELDWTGGIGPWILQRKNRSDEPRFPLMAGDIPEKDWKLLRQLKPIALDRFCERVLSETSRIATASSGTGHERYLKLYEYIQRQNEDLARAFDDHRRSTALWKIAHIHSLGLFTDQELGGFSEATRRIVLELARPISLP